MNHLPALNSAFCLRLTFTLLHFLWQGAAIFTLALAAGWAMRKASASARYWAYVGLFAAMAFCPPVTFFMLAPEASTGRSPAAATEAPPRAAPGNPAALTDLAPRFDPYQGPAIKPLPMGDAGGNAEAARPARRIGLWKERLLSIVSSDRFHRAAPYVSALYFAGVVLMLARLLLALRGGRGLRGQSQPLRDPAILATLRRSADALRLRSAPAIAWCERVAVPTIVGIIKPTILLPLTLASGLSPKQVETLLLHELAHLRRYDPWVNLAQWVIETALFFHPAVWALSRRIRSERELACDDMVIAAGIEQSHYADSLLRMAELSQLAAASTPGVALALGAHGLRFSNFGNRVLRLVEGGNATESVRLSRVWPVGVALVLLMLAGFSVAFKVEGQSPQKKEGEQKPANPVVIFSSGVRARVVGVAMHPRKQSGYWMIDGTPMTGVPKGHEDLGASISPSHNKIAREFYVSIDQLPGGKNVGVKYETVPSGSKAGGPNYKRDPDHKNGLIRLWFATDLPPEAKTTTLRLGIAAGPWKTIATSFGSSASGISRRGDASTKNQEIGIIFGNLVRKGNDLHLAVTDNAFEQDYRVLAIDQSEREHEPVMQGSTVSAGMRQTDLILQNLPANVEIKHFAFQVRDYEWREIKNIALEPDKSLKPKPNTMESMNEAAKSADYVHFSRPPYPWRSQPPIPFLKGKMMLHAELFNSGLTALTVNVRFFQSLDGATREMIGEKQIQLPSGRDSVEVVTRDAKGKEVSRIAPELGTVPKTRVVRVPWNAKPGTYLVTAEVMPVAPNPQPFTWTHEISARIRVTEDAAQTVHRLQLRWVAAEGEQAKAEKVPTRDANQDNGYLYLLKEKIFTEDNIVSAEARPSSAGSNYEVLLQFTEHSKTQLAKITRENIGRRLAIVVDEKVISAPMIQSQIPEGKVVIAGQFTKAEAEAIAAAIQPSSPKQNNEDPAEVVMRLPEGNYQAEYKEGWDELLKSHMEMEFTDRMTPGSEKPFFLVSVKPGLPFSLAFDAFAEKAGDSRRYPAGSLSLLQGGGRGLHRTPQAIEGWTVDQMGEDLWRLVLVPSEDVAKKRPPIRTYYGKEFVTDWQTFSRKPKEIFLPEADQAAERGVFFDLASGKMLHAKDFDDDAYLEMLKSGKGDIAYDDGPAAVGAPPFKDALLCIRGAKAEIWQEGKYAPARVIEGHEDLPDVTVYDIPRFPSRFEVTTAESKKFEVTFTRRSDLPTKSGIYRGVVIEYVEISNGPKEKNRLRSASSEDESMLAEPPRLRFLAWQTDKPEAQEAHAWRPDGTPLTDPAERKLLSDGGARFRGPEGYRSLMLLFSHPMIDTLSAMDAELLDDQGYPLDLKGGGSASSIRIVDGAPRAEGLASFALGVGPDGLKTDTADIRFRYSIGPWSERKQNIAPDFRGFMALGNEIDLGAIGQDDKGRAFISLVRNVEVVPNIQCGFTATTKDGREITSTNRSSGSGSKERLQERTIFDVPLSEIKEFHFRTRPMREMVFRNVALHPKIKPE